MLTVLLSRGGDGKDGQSHPRSDSVLRNVVVGGIAPPSTGSNRALVGRSLPD